MAKPVEVVAVLKDFFSGPGRAVAQTAVEMGKEFKLSADASGKLSVSLTDAADKAEKSSSRLGKVVQALTGVRGLLLAGVAAVGANQLVRDLTETAEKLDDISAASKRTGVSVPEISKLQVAAKLVNVEFGQLVQGLGFLNRAVASFDQNKNVQEAFGRLRISPETVRSTKSLSDLLPQIAQGLDSLTDGDKSLVLQTLFGRGGIALGPLFEGGLTDFKRALDEVEKAGVVVTRTQVELGSKLDDQVQLLAASWFKVKAEFLAAVGPTAIAALERFRQVIAATPDKVRGLRTLIADAFSDEATTRTIAVNQLKLIGSSVLQLLLDGAVNIGILLGTTVVQVLKVGVETLAPVFARVFDAAISPIIRKIPGLSTFAATDSERLRLTDSAIAGFGTSGNPGLGAQFLRAEAAREAGRAAEAELEETQRKIEEIRKRIDAVDRAGGDAATLNALQEAFNQLQLRAAAAQASIERADKAIKTFNTAGGLEGFTRLSPFDRLPRQLRELVAERDKLRARLQTEDADIGERFRKAAVEAGRAISTEFGVLVDDLKSDLNAVFTSIPSVQADTRREIELANIEAQRAADQASKALQDEIARRTQEANEADQKRVDELLAQAAKAQDAVRDLSVDLSRAFGSRTDTAAMELANKQLERRAKLMQETGVIFSAVEPLLRKVEDAESRRLSLDKALIEVTKQAADAERRRTDALKDAEAQQETGLITANEARKAQNAANVAFKQEVENLIGAVASLKAQYPEYAELIDKIADKAAKLKETADRTRELPTTFSGGLRLGFSETLAAMADLVDAGRQVGTTIATALTQGVSRALVDVIANAKNAGEAFRELARNTVNSLLQIITQLLIAKTLTAALGGTELGTFLGIAARRNSGGLVFNGGGHVPGGRGSFDDVNAKLTRGEFVQPVPSVDYYGLPFMEAVRRRLIPQRAAGNLLASLGIRTGGSQTLSGALAAGGQAGGPSAGGDGRVLVVNEREADKFHAGSGQSLLRFLEKNRGSARAALGI